MESVEATFVVYDPEQANNVWELISLAGSLSPRS